jgi:two-component system, LytTR family, sensor kinase
VKHVRAAILSLAAWTIPGLLTGAVAVLFFPVAPEVRAYIGRFAAAFMVSWWIWAAITPVMRVALSRVPFERPWPRAVAVHGLLAIFGAFLFALWATWVLWLSRPPTLPPEPYSAGLRRFIVGHMGLGVAVYAAVVAVIAAREERAARQRRELDTARLEADLAQAQLRALQMQLQPHFLFNTLHSIAMLTDSEPAVAERMAVKLADLLRETLRLRDVPELTLREELDLLRAYLEIEETRFAERLGVTIAVSDDLLDVLVPSFLLQPVVENAVRHGVSDRVEGGCVWVTAARDGDGDALLLTVEDDGPGFSVDALATGGLGLSATRDRLSLRYGAAASLRCEARAGGSGSRVAIRIPMSKSNPRNA